MSADVQRREAGARAQLAVQVRVVTRELDAPRRARLTLTLNGRPSGTRDVTLPASGTLAVAFDPATPPAGRIRGVIKIDPDALPGDDEFHFTLSADDDVRVLLVTPPDRRPDETLFFERALGVGRNPVLRVDRRGTSGLTAGALNAASLVVLWDIAPPEAASAALQAWVERGGGIVVVAGSRLASRTTSSSLLPASLRGTSDRLADHGGTFGEVSLDHPLLGAFREAPAALQSARFLRYVRVEPRSDADVLARFDDGLPAVVERRVGTGRVLLVAAPLDAQAGDFPLQPAYLPFVRRLVLHASGHEARPLWLATGEHWVTRSTVRQPVVSGPSGGISRPRADSGVVAVPITEAGFYALYDGRVGGDPVAVTATNSPPGESDLTPVDPRELLIGVRQSDSTSVASSLTTLTPAQNERAQNLWRTLLILVAVVLIAETVVASLGRRGVTGRA